jgi:hypothetical protein
VALILIKLASRRKGASTQRLTFTNLICEPRDSCFQGLTTYHIAGANFFGIKNSERVGSCSPVPSVCLNTYSVHNVPLTPDFSWYDLFGLLGIEVDWGGLNPIQLLLAKGF